MIIKKIVDSTEASDWVDAEIDIDTSDGEFGLWVDVSGAGGSSPTIVSLGRLNTRDNIRADGSNLGDSITTSKWYSDITTGTANTFKQMDWDLIYPMDKLAIYWQTNNGSRRIRIWVVYNEGIK